jgi:ATPase subunit of ABC transporter with duplicated ATPase domains
VRRGYLPQDDEGLDPEVSAREAVTSVRGNLLASEGWVGRGLLERLGPRGKTQWAPAGELSGGERRRARLIELGQQLRQVQAEKEELKQRWLLVAERIPS